MELNVQVEVAARRFAGTDVAVINVMFPSHPASRMEVEAFRPTLLRVTEAPDGAMDLTVDGEVVTTITDANGDLMAFRRLVTRSGVFALSLMTGTERTPLEDGKFIARTFIAENQMGRVISDSGVVEASPEQLAMAEQTALEFEESYHGHVMQDPAELAAFLSDDTSAAEHRVLDPSIAN